MITGNIVQKPIITEKSLRDAQKGIFTFEVGSQATKSQIKSTVESLFKVHVRKVTSAVFKGKKRIVGKKRMPVYGADRKKAWVKLNASEKIDLFEIGERK